MDSRNWSLLAAGLFISDNQYYNAGHNSHANSKMKIDQPHDERQGTILTR